MWDTYEAYCSFMRSKNCEPLSYEIFNRNYRRKSEEEKEAELLAHTPFISRKKESFRNVEPTLSNHEAPVTTPTLKVNLMDIPKKSDHFRDTTKKVLSPKKSTPEPKLLGELKRRANAVPKTSLKGMSKEDRQEHRNKLARERRKRDKKNGVLKAPSEDRREKQRAYCKEYYKNNKEARLEAARIKRENMTSEQIAEKKAYMSQWQKDNRDQVNANAREWKKNKRNPQPQNNTSCSAEQSLSA